MNTATAFAHPNIAFIKYWGNRDERLRLPVNGSISMNLSGLETRTTVTFDPSLPHDNLLLNGRRSTGPALNRVCAMLDRVRALAGITHHAAVQSENNFPMGAGIASSASAFAALAAAAAAAAGLNLPESDLSRLARSGSGSASRSVPAGFVEWQAGTGDADSFAFSIASPDHWDLVDCIAVVSQAHKRTGSTEGHELASTSPVQAARVADAPRRLKICREAILNRDFHAFASIVEQDSNLMHGVMMTSAPPLLYWEPGTLSVMHQVASWREKGLPVCYTIDAGPNVHVLCLSSALESVQQGLRQLTEVRDVLVAHPGGGVRVEVGLE